MVDRIARMTIPFFGPLRPDGLKYYACPYIVSHPRSFRNTPGKRTAGITRRGAAGRRPVPVLVPVRHHRTSRSSRGPRACIVSALPLTGRQRLVRGPPGGPSRPRPSAW
ncbi:hypothetical protein N657DRAFT_323485 [Parathielavia appendiculata]|uniref:Uncharacterized protein n=1 Tax=Parathielavia appendiculata TaxID=2587402 RepID=A0AAN6YZ27_9PEZI|nr:hypothetical protein N657DRAFT_323485 [Parathielavia appendiculata]